MARDIKADLAIYNRPLPMEIRRGWHPWRSKREVGPVTAGFGRAQQFGRSAPKEPKSAATRRGQESPRSERERGRKRLLWRLVGQAKASLSTERGERLGWCWEGRVNPLTCRQIKNAVAHDVNHGASIARSTTSIGNNGSPGRTRTCDMLITGHPCVSARPGLSLHHPVSLAVTGDV